MHSSPDMSCDVPALTTIGLFGAFMSTYRYSSYTTAASLEECANTCAENNCRFYSFVSDASACIYMGEDAIGHAYIMEN